MALTLRKLTANTAQTSIVFDGEEVHIEYFPAKITEKTFVDLQKFTNVTSDTIVEGFSLLNDTLSALIKTWDVYNDEAETQAYPTDSESLSALPLIFRLQILNGILADARPNQEALQMQN